MPENMRTRVARLTPRQRQVVRLVSLGCTIEDMAAVLDLAPGTIDNHRSSAMKALAVNRIGVLTRVAIKHRVSSLNDQLTASEKRKIGRRGRRK
jgi:DNA-binding NarL/FixJ family response regulator